MNLLAILLRNFLKNKLLDFEDLRNTFNFIEYMQILAQN